jgi:hypothetical protein
MRKSNKLLVISSNHCCFGIPQKAYEGQPLCLEFQPAHELSQIWLNNQQHVQHVLMPNIHNVA